MSNDHIREYPRVLIVAKTRINDMDSLGGTLRNWFADWPKEHLAQIFSGGSLEGPSFCSRNYHLGTPDRRFGRFFAILKGAAGKSMSPVVPARNSGHQHSSALKRMLRKIVSQLTLSGIWEIIFAPRVSPALSEWIREFNPEVMYIQGQDLSFMRIPLALNRRFGIPFALQVTDDWPAHLYVNSPISFILRPACERTFRKLLSRSALLMGIGETMAREYRGRYGHEFVPMMVCDDPARFEAAIPERVSPEGSISIVYSGSLALNRWKALLNLNEAARILHARGINVAITAFSGDIPVEAAEAFGRTTDIGVRPPLHDSEVPGILKGADLLFLPESFDREYRDYIRLSISSKAHLYMMSGKPALVYGPSEVGVVEYARREGWGLVVSEQNPGALAEAVARLATDEPYRLGVLQKARETAERNHSAAAVRELFRERLTSASRKANGKCLGVCP